MFIIKLAGINISITSICTETKKVFADFIINEEAKYCIEITEERLRTEKELLISCYSLNNLKDYEIEVNALYRDIPKILIKENIILMHGVLVKKDNKGYIFTAPSGTGKSTHARLWEEAFKENVFILNGDKPLLRLANDAVIAYGSPWKGKENIGTNECVKLCGICNLHRGLSNSIKPVNFDSKSLTWLMAETQIKGLEAYAIERVRWFKQASKYIELYELTCNKSTQAAVVAYSGMITKI